MNAWLRQHLLALADALLHVRRAKGSFALNVVVVAIALALPFAGVTLMENLQPVAQHLTVEPAVSVFMAGDATRETAQALAPQLRRILDENGGGRVSFVSRESALSTLQEKTGIAAALAVLGENPLPDAYLLTLQAFDTGVAAGRLQPMIARLSALPGVAQVQVDAEWVKRLSALLHVLRIALALLASTLAVVVIAVSFNTIRLQVMTQHAEIGVARLVGATDRYISRPFYYTGALLGLAAGLLALAVVALALQPLNQAIGEFARLYGSQFRLAPLDWPQSLLLLLSSALLGLIGSTLSVRRHLARPD